MLATNILLSGNNYHKIVLLFRFMNMGIVTKSTFFVVQDSYCVDTIKEFWQEKRSAITNLLREKDHIVAIGECTDIHEGN